LCYDLPIWPNEDEGKFRVSRCKKFWRFSRIRMRRLAAPCLPPGAGPKSWHYVLACSGEIGKINLGHLEY